MDIKFPYYYDELSVGRYEIRGYFEGEPELGVTQSVIPETIDVNGKEVILESFSVDEMDYSYTAKIQVRENFIPVALLATGLVGGGIFLNQANATIDKISRLAIISIPVMISVITFLIILKK